MIVFVPRPSVLACFLLFFLPPSLLSLPRNPPGLQHELRAEKAYEPCLGAVLTFTIED